MSPGGQPAVLRPILAVVRAATLLLLLTPELSQGEVVASDNVVIEIGNIKQPDNCSLFLTNLEVTMITRSIRLCSGEDISTCHPNLPENCKIKYKK